MIDDAAKSQKYDQNDFLTELINFSEWVDYEEDTAYIFLLRDTLLPCIQYLKKYKNNIYPWLLGRKTLSKISGCEHVDDAFRSCIYEALERIDFSDFDDFCSIVLPKMRTELNRHPKIEKFLSALLAHINEKRIVVVESGCTGTFPLLLKSIDNRVEIRMYTTYPYLFNVYKDVIYTQEYEKNRLFETLYSQDLYFEFSDFKDGKFYVNTCNNSVVCDRAYAEVNTILKKG